MIPTTVKPPSIFRDLSNYLGGRVILLGLGFASFPLLTRMLPVADYGVVSLTLRVVLVLTVFSKCGFQYSVNRFYHETIADGSEAAHRRYYSTLVFSPLLITALVVAIYFLILAFVFPSLHGSLVRGCFMVAPALVFIRVMQSLLLGFLRNESKSRLHSIFEIASKTLTLAALVCLFFSPYRGAIGFLIASVISEGVVVLLQLRLLHRRGVLALKSVDWGLTKISLAFGAPLIAYEFASVVLDSGDRFLVQHFLGDVQLGYYSAAYNIGSYFQDTVMTPMNLAFLPIYLRLWSQDGPEITRRFISKSLSWFIVAISLITCLTLLCSKGVILLLASRRYLDAHHLLPILIPALMLYATHIFLNAGMIITKRSGMMAKLVVVSAIANIGLNFVLIPHFGIVGASYATLASYALLIGLMARANQQILPLKLDVGLVCWSLIAGSLTWLLVRPVEPANVVVWLAVRVSLGSLCFGVLLGLASRSARRALRDLHARLARSRATEVVSV